MVLVEGAPQKSCGKALSTVAGKRVVTVEGLGTLARPSLDRLIAKNGAAPRLQQLMMAVGPGNGGYVNTDPHNQMMANVSWDSQTTHFNNETLRSAKDVFAQLTSSGLPSNSGGTAPAVATPPPGPPLALSVPPCVPTSWWSGSAPRTKAGSSPKRTKACFAPWSSKAARRSV